MSADSRAPVHVGGGGRCRGALQRGRTRARIALRCWVCARARAPARRSAWSTQALPDLRNARGTMPCALGSFSSGIIVGARLRGARRLAWTAPP